MGVNIDQAPGILQEALVRALKLYIFLLVPPCPKYLWVFGHWYYYKTPTAFPDRLNGDGLTSARLRPVERLPDSVRSKLPPLYVPVSPSPLSRVKLAGMCGTRSALRRWSCYIAVSTSMSPKIILDDRRFNLHVQGRTTCISGAYQPRRDSRDGCFWPTREEEDSRASHKPHPKSWNLGRGGNVVRAGHRRGGSVGGWDGDRERGLTTKQAFKA